MIRLVKTDRQPDLSGVTPALVVGATLFFAAILTAHFVGRHYDHKLTPCLFKLVTDKPCFLCGGTRASLNLAMGNPIIALRFNPLVTLILGSVALGLLLKFVFGRRIILDGPPYATAGCSGALPSRLCWRTGSISSIPCSLLWPTWAYGRRKTQNN